MTVRRVHQTALTGNLAFDDLVRRICEVLSSTSEDQDTHETATPVDHPDDSVTADKLAHNIDATGIGFDADKVDGIHAAATAIANKLLALDASGHFPISTYPEAFLTDGSRQMDGDVIPETGKSEVYSLGDTGLIWKYLHLATLMLYKVIQFADYGSPTVAGQLQRNGALLEYFWDSAARTVLLDRLPVDIDANLHVIKWLGGFGGAAGDAVRVVSSAADIKTACEDTTTFLVIILEGSYDIAATIAPTSYTRILGIGHVQLNWTGSTAGHMFNNASATNLVYDNLHIGGSANNFYPIYLRQSDRMYRCEIEHKGYGVQAYNSDGVIADCEIKTRLYVGAVSLEVRNCKLSHEVQILNGRHLRFINCESTMWLYFNQASGYTADKSVEVIGGQWGTTTNAAVYFRCASGTVTISNVKFIGVRLEPVNNTKPAVDVEDDANLTVTDIWFDNCTLADASDAYKIPSNPTVNRWRFDNNYYSSVTTRYNFTDPGDFVYTNDG